MEYFRDRYGVSLCTGCGRCIAYCPTRIDWVDIVNRMVSHASTS
jgi:ferredoxin